MNRDAVALGRMSAPVLLLAATMAAASGAAVAQQPLAAIALVVVGVLGLATIAWPETATLAVVFVTYLSVTAVAVNYHGAPLVVGLAIPLLLAIPVAYHLSRGEPLLVTSGFLLILAFLVVELVSTLVSIDVYTGWEKVKTFAFEGVIVYFLVVNAVRTTATLRRVMWVLLAAGSALAALTFFQHLTGDYARAFGGFAQVGRDYFTGHATEPRLSGPLGDPNYYAQILLVLAPLGLMLAWSERSRLLRVLAFAATALVMVAVALTSSRGAGVAFLLLLVIMATLRYVRARQLAVVVVGIVVLVASIPTYRDRVATLASLTGPTEVSRHESGADRSVRSRSTEMLAAVLVFTDHPVLGVGPDQFPLYYQDYASQLGGELHDTNKFGARKGEAPQREAHNIVLSIAADLGLAGLAAFFGLVYVTMRDLVRARRHWLGKDARLADAATGFLLAVTAYITTGLFLTLAFERYFWLLLALAGAVGAIAARERAEQGQPSSASRMKAAIRSS